MLCVCVCVRACVPACVFVFAFVCVCERVRECVVQSSPPVMDISVCQRGRDQPEECTPLPRRPSRPEPKSSLLGGGRDFWGRSAVVLIAHRV